MLVDSHCHLDFVGDVEARAQAMARARAAGVEHVVVPGVSPEEWRELELMRSLDGVDVAVGIHPEWLGKLTDAEVSDGLARLATEAKRLGAVAIGEFGMDGPAEKAGVPYDRQRAVLDAHLEVARALELPVILHVFRCQGVALDALKRHGPLRAGGVVHSYSGSAELVPQYVGLNLHLSFAGAVTRPNAERPIKALRAVPPERLLVETDSPDQLPDGVDAERTEPAHVRVVAEAVARHLGETADVVAARTTTNAVRLFRLAR